MVVIEKGGLMLTISLTSIDYITSFLDKVIFPEDYINECWGWSGYKNKLGYAKFRLGDGKRPSAHRAAYILLVSDDISGLVIDHLCRNPECTNPNHLEAVTMRENTLRGISPPALNKVKTHCKYGHSLLQGEYWNSKSGRLCKQCARRKWNDWYRKKKEA